MARYFYAFFCAFRKRRADQCNCRVLFLARFALLFRFAIQHEIFLVPLECVNGRDFIIHAPESDGIRRRYARAAVGEERQ